MILDVDSLAQASADASNIPQVIYQRKDGSYLFCAQGNTAGLKMALAPNEQITYVKTIKPSHWPTEEK